MLPNHFAWTADEYQSPKYGRSHLLVGYTNEHGVHVDHHASGFQRGVVAVFVVGLPEKLDNPQNTT